MGPAALFLLLGVLVFPSRLVHVLGASLVVAAILMFLARPIATAICLARFRTGARQLAVVSWAGLRGAVPIVLATIPLTAGYPDGELVFDVVFVVVLASLALQGSTIGPLARRLGIDEPNAAAHAGVAVLDTLVADLVEVRLTDRSAVSGRPLRAVALPKAGASRSPYAGQTFVPDGDTTLAGGDVLLVAVAPDTDPDDLVAWATGAIRA